MDFKQIEYVITIAEQKHLFSAAEKLFLSPSALSQYISKLESELSTTLFLRRKNGWIPTRAGQIYIDMAREILKTQRKAYVQISDLAESKTGHFTVGVTPGRGTEMFSKIFPEFKKEYPHFELNLFEGTVLEICRKILDGTVDIGFVTSGKSFPNISTQFQCREEILLALPKNHPLAQDFSFENENHIDISALKDEEFLLAGENTTLRLIADDLFSKSLIKPKILFETPSLLTLNMLASSGYGPAFVPSFYAKKDSIAVYFHTEPALYWDLLVAFDKEHYLTNAEKYLIELSTAYLKN